MGPATCAYMCTMCKVCLSCCAVLRWCLLACFASVSTKHLTLSLHKARPCISISFHRMEPLRYRHMLKQISKAGFEGHAKQVLVEVSETNRGTRSNISSCCAGMFWHGINQPCSPNTFAQQIILHHYCGRISFRTSPAQEHILPHHWWTTCKEVPGRLNERCDKGKVRTAMQ